MDIHSSLGTSASVDLVVRGDRFARRAHAYSTQCGDRLNFEPKNSFQLVPGAFNRIGVQFRPNQAGSRSVIIVYFHFLFVYSFDCFYLASFFLCFVFQFFNIHVVRISVFACV